MALIWRSDKVVVRSGSAPLEYHTFVYPVGDLIEHDPEEYSCPCMPEYKIHIGVHYPAEGICLCTWFELTHHSLDGRELFE